jgi:hypothetical protein
MSIAYFNDITLQQYSHPIIGCLQFKIESTPKSK